MAREREFEENRKVERKAATDPRIGSFGRRQVGRSENVSYSKEETNGYRWGGDG